MDLDQDGFGALAWAAAMLRSRISFLRPRITRNDKPRDANKKEDRESHVAVTERLCLDSGSRKLLLCLSSEKTTW